MLHHISTNSTYETEENVGNTVLFLFSRKYYKLIWIQIHLWIRGLISCMMWREFSAWVQICTLRPLLLLSYYGDEQYYTGLECIMSFLLCTCVLFFMLIYE